VTQVARSAGRRLGLNEDLIECIALVHDVGHPPFGHQGEVLLADLMGAHGGFEHNRQGLRIVEDLETRYPEFAGLNLTYEVRESIIKHSAHYDRAKVPDRFQPRESPLLEAQLVDEIDSVVYDCHDIDDGLRGGYITLDGLQDVALWRGAWAEAVDDSPRGTSQALLVDRAVRRLLDSLLSDLVDTTRAACTRRGIGSAAEVRACPDQLAGVSGSLREEKERLEAWLFANLYRHHTVNRTFQRAKRILADLFTFYVEHPECMPPQARDLRERTPQRMVADYIAGMTDRYAIDEHDTLLGGWKR
jgi:dGTPase